VKEKYSWNKADDERVSCDSRRMQWISLISFGYIEVDFVVGGWISVDFAF